MIRPLYETDTDIQNERSVVEAICGAWGLSARKMKIACMIDYALIRDEKVVAVMEIKCRKYAADEIDRMGGLIMSAMKMQAGRLWRDIHGVVFMLAIRLTDGLYIWISKPGDEWPVMELAYKGRTDRGDWQDVEPCCMLPMDMFSRWEI